MGTVVQLKVYSSQADKIIKEAFALIDGLEKKMSSNIKDSEISKINRLAGNKPVKVSEDTYQVVKRSLEYAHLSQGSFDPTIGPVVKLWGIGTDKARVPKKEELEKELQLVDFNQVKLVPKERKIFLEQAEMALDVGAIAKGYAADKVIEFLKQNGVENAYISLGGNVSVLGTKPDGSSWKVGIQDPLANRGEIMAAAKLEDKTVVTSGNYERYFIQNGRRYHHILNPKTGYPARKGIISSTIITTNSFDADALSTVIYVLGVKKGLQLVNRLSDVEAMIVTKEKEVYVTSGLEDKVEVINNKYKVNKY